MADPVPTTEQLRNTIDSGASGEKVEHFDPAAAPLGTDAEASGNSPTRTERAMAARTTTRVAPHRQPNGVPIYLGLIAVLAILLLVIAFFARS